MTADTKTTTEQIDAFAHDLRLRFRLPFDLPEPNHRLDLESRAGQPERQFKHLHQMCLGQVEHLATSCEFKLLGLLDGYLACASGSSVIGCYLFARTVLEECAFAIEVQRRLSTVAQKTDSSWLPKGEEFFSFAVRFRFATADKALQKALEASNFPPKLLKPVNVMSCVAALATRSEVSHLGPEYDRLCDYVHHNGPSHFTASSGFFVGRAGMHHESGGMLLLNKAGPVTRYEYPNRPKLLKAVDDTASTVALASKTCKAALDELPRTPFASDTIRKMTGTATGFTLIGRSDKSKPH